MPGDARGVNLCHAGCELGAVEKSEKGAYTGKSGGQGSATKNQLYDNDSGVVGCAINSWRPPGPGPKRDWLFIFIFMHAARH